jgi:hypothetical protein
MNQRFNYLVLIANPKRCERDGVPVSWHTHRVYTTRKEAEENAATLDRPHLDFVIRIYKIIEVKRDNCVRIIDTERAA